MTDRTDPFDALRRPAQPIEPDPGFAEALRERLRAAILRDAGEPVSRTESGAAMTTTESTGTTSAAPRSLTPYLAVSDARAALGFYVEVLGATRRGEPIVMPDGRVGHAELAIGDSVLMLAEEFPEIGHTAAPSGGAAIRVEVSDVDGSMERAVSLGARQIGEIEDSGYGRNGSITDPFGQRWNLAQAPGTVPGSVTASGVDTPVRHGQAAYFTFQVPDDSAAKDFYGAVLGWQFSPGYVEGAWGAEGTGLTGGLWGGPDRQVGWKIMYAVDDLAAALDRVRAHGGTAGEVERQPYGLTADCADDQSIEFWLWETPRA